MAPRLALYGVASAVLAVIVVGSAMSSRPNFFSAAVAVGASNASLLVLANFALFNAVCFGIVVKMVFFGQLRTIEHEHLFERLWVFVTESLIALTIFRNDFSIPFAIMYSVLLFLRCFHWITADRVDYMDQVPPPGPPLLFHLRIGSIIAILAILDLSLLTYAFRSIGYKGVSSMILFASEYTILFASILGTAARYTVGIVDLRRARGRQDAPSWEAKSMYLFYIDLCFDFVKLIVYLGFFIAILLNFGLPLHIARDVFFTVQSFLRRCNDLIRYRRATRDMDAQYPNATAEELETAGDPTCIICREEMAVRLPGEHAEETEGPNETPKKLGCGHIFHFHCLRSWLERQQSCPTCRRDVFSGTPADRGTPAPAAGRAPPADPGAPAAAAQQPPAPHAALGRDQELFNRLFRIPGARAANMFPPARAAQPAAPTAPAAAQEPTTTTESAAARVQTGIWGGPVTPGAFFRTPLGAAPRLAPLAAHDRPRQPTHVQRAQQPGPRLHVDLDQPPPELSPPLTSGFTTPSFSRAPEIFPPAADSSKKGRGASGAEKEEEEEESKEVGGDEQDLTEEERRRKVAEAAMRRALPTSKELPSLDKGKGKEATSEAAAAPVSVPYLGSTLGPLDPQTSRPTLSILGQADKWRVPPTLDRNGSIQALDERLKVLREADETIWRLVGELTALRSRWESEAGEELRDGGGGGGASSSSSVGVEGRGP